MKKILITFVFLIDALGVGHAQLQEGTWMLGSDLGSNVTSPSSSGLFGLNFGLKEGAGFSVGLSPKLGYFVNDNFLLGAVVNLGFSKSPKITDMEPIKETVYGIQAFSRYYLSPGEAGIDNLLNSGRFL